MQASGIWFCVAYVRLGSALGMYVSMSTCLCFILFVSISFMLGTGFLMEYGLYTQTLTQTQTDTLSSTHRTTNKCSPRVEVYV